MTVEDNRACLCNSKTLSREELMEFPAKHVLQVLTLILFTGFYVRSTAKVIYGREKLRKKEKPADVYCGQWCEVNTKNGVLRKYCDVGGCCVPGDQNSLNEDTDFCCVPLLTVILISVFVGIPVLILLIVCCVCCIKYCNNKNKTQSFTPSQDSPDGSPHNNREPKPHRPVHMIGPPLYEGSSGSATNVPGIPEYRVRARALSPPPPYSTGTTEERATAEQDKVVENPQRKRQNTIKTSAQITTALNFSGESTTLTRGSGTWTSKSPRIFRSETQTERHSRNTEREVSDLETHLEFI